MPKVSVLMPIYKTNEVYLRAAIESILSQTFTDFEFLILDDCPDESREKIIASYSDERIKYTKNSCNLGISASRNKLIDMAQGEYLAVFDHDDISLPERFAKEVAYLDANPQCGVRMSNMGTFQQAKTADIYYRAMLAKAKLRMLTGEMVDRKRAGNYAFNLGRVLRDLFMSFPVRYGALIAAEISADKHQITAILDEYIRKILTESQDILSKEL